MPRVDGHSAVISSALAAASGAPQQPGWDGRRAWSPGRPTTWPARRSTPPSPRPSGAPTSTWPCAPRQRPGSGSSRRTAGASCPRQTTSPTCSRRGSGATARRPSATGPSSSRPSRRPARPPPRSGRTGWPATSTSTGRSARAPPTCGSRTPTPRAAAATATSASSRSATTSRRAHWPASRAASTSSGTPVSTTVVAGIEAAADLVGADVVRRARHRLEHLEMVDAEGIARLVALGDHSERAARVRRPLGRGRGHVCRAAGARARALRMNPFATMLAAGHDPRPRLGLPGHPVRAVGGGPGLRQPPRPPTSASPPGRPSSPTPVAAGAPPGSTTGATSTSGAGHVRGLGGGRPRRPGPG